MPKTRKWSDEYVKYGFTALLDDNGGPDRAQCMTCHIIICNSNLKPARLREHQLKHRTAEHEQSLEAPLQAKRARYDKKEAAKKMKDVSLSNNVIGGRVVDMSCDILDQIVEEIQASPTRISLQLDESTDVSNMSQLIVYTRYIKDGEIKDE
ncbi:hypothetical protein Pcinc_000835 [Petrolisthes cinctipes]|uniref:BED-type domain-containing protein n=1 Tax=Petrolisthes cinctipes TaxID=88211 RepID=A0AAE1L3Q9_PETCI|nr:hypothetical protein Pcinc_000835 [Petrolisthes cinctipes]